MLCIVLFTAAPSQTGEARRRPVSGPQSRRRSHLAVAIPGPRAGGRAGANRVQACACRELAARPNASTMRCSIAPSRHPPIDRRPKPSLDQFWGTSCGVPIETWAKREQLVEGARHRVVARTWPSRQNKFEHRGTHPGCYFTPNTTSSSASGSKPFFVNTDGMLAGTQPIPSM